MRSTYKVHNPKAVYFITSTIVDWIEIFTSEKYFNVLLEAINFYISKKSLTVYAYVVMKNHFHLICKSENLTETVRLIKSYTAREIIYELEKESRADLLIRFKENKKDYKVGRTYQIWQEGFHPKEMINNEVLKQKIEYVHLNPVRGNFCVKSSDWKYSSALFYETGEQSFIPLERIV
ncbi:MAG: transposase [Ignavibacteria bacterium]|nr:transposase [Ignavibacteria bacterium]